MQSHSLTFLKLGRYVSNLDRDQFFYRAPDNFLKQGVAEASLEAKGVFLQNQVVFSLPSFNTGRFYKLQV